MFSKVLIANRGEIAVRVARTLRAMGIGVVAVYSEADRTALHVQVADEAYEIGPAPALESYLSIPAVLDAAKRSGAEAIHPGYGFLSENAAFAQAVADAGLVFIGPPPAAIRAMGDKAGAKRLMAAAGVPTVPGYTGDDQAETTLTAEAERIGFPLLIKAVAGGGGMGMREVYDGADFAEALAAARRTAHRAFGDDRVMLERLIVRPRHVEVQIFADACGHVVSLGERECSIQRRHQKVIEESPSPAVTPAVRQRLSEAAIIAARTAGYVNAGTVEFLLDSHETFFFLEMNTRLQVEHPVTEGVTGLDLVRLQVEIAAGHPLPFTQDAVTITGHAIECRVYAEDPTQEYLPQTGTVTALAALDLPGLRIDGALFVGATVTPDYDPLLVKVITHGATRDAAIARMQDALANYRIAGVVTNLPQLRAVLATDAFRAGETHTGFLTEHWHPSSPSDQLPPEILLAIAGYEATRHTLPSSVAVNPWQSIGPFRDLKAPLTGIVTRVLVQPGEQVSARQPLVVLEAMKMEHTIAAPGPARVRHVHAAQGDRVTGGAVLVELEAAPPQSPEEGMTDA
ncbi:MAG: methylcrotonoyl-CoA carboxylase [Thermomicrobia bacterium]|nr:methylcrotonoyl-CoA carboxylase [Thermomicrobia bacterium]